MVKIGEIVSGESVKRRRERIGVSQGAVAERVRKLAAKPFSQQSLNKFEKGGESKFAIYILGAIDELEREAGLTFVRPSDVDSAMLQQSMDSLSDDELKDKIIQIIDRLSPRASIEVAQMLLERAKQEM